MCAERAIVVLADRGTPGSDSARAIRPGRSTRTFSGFVVGVGVVGLGAAALVLDNLPPLTVTSLLYTGLAVLAELIVVAPRYAGWPSYLYPIATLVVVGDEPLAVVPALLLALAVRWTRLLRSHDNTRDQGLRVFMVGSWLVAGVVGALVARQINGALVLARWAPLLTSPATGEPIHLASAVGWALSTAAVTLAIGVLAAGVAGYSWSEAITGSRAERVVGGSVRVSVVVYTVVAVCDLLLSVVGPPLVAVSVALALVALAGQSRQRRSHYRRAVDLAEVVEARDAATATHLRMVGDLVARVSGELGLRASTVEDYGQAALLHDLGKLAVSPRIVLKPGALDLDEWAEMRSHTSMGQAILRAMPGFSTAAAIAGHHHERWDGRGYPDGLRQTEIPLAARITTVVDAFDAMTTDRPYRRGIAAAAALEELVRQQGTQFDPAVVRAFRRARERVAGPTLWQFFPMIEE